MPNFAPNFQYPEDIPHVSGDRGTAALVVRKDVESSIAGTDGDYSLLQVNATGSLRVVGTFTISGGTIVATQGTTPWVVGATDFDIRDLVFATDKVDVSGSTVTAETIFDYPEDSPHVSGDIGAFILAVRNDAGTALAADGDYSPFQVNAAGELRVTTTGGTPTGRDDTDNQAAVATGLNTTVNRVYVWDGANWDRWTGAVTGPLTDAQLRATPVPISGTVSVTEPVTVDGIVALDAPTLAALETTTVLQGTSPWVVSGTVTVNEPVTVDAVDLDIRNLLPSQDGVRVGYQRDPAWVGVYSFSESFNGTTTAINNFVSIFNPIGSGRDLVLLYVAVESYSVGIFVATNTIRLSRITTASGGVIFTGGAEFQTTDPSRVAEVRVTNPTVTVLASISEFGQNQGITAVGSTAVSRREYRPDPSWGEFLLVPGEGVVLRQNTAGDTDQRFSFTVVWAER